MKRLTCEMCGSTNIIKQDGLYVCQDCGTKYTVEEAKKMMVEGTVEVAGTVKVDNSGSIDSYLQMAENALDASNNAEAENYANKIIEIDPRAWRAWFIKGKAAGWQTTRINNRYPESIVNWINAYQFAPEAEKTGLAADIQSEAMNISMAILQMECNSFVNYRSEDNANDIKNALSMMEQKLGDLKTKTGIDVYTDALKTILERSVNTGVVNASNAADKEFGTERRDQDKFNWDQYTDAQDRCLSLLDKAYSLTNDDDLCFTICKNYIAIAEQVRDSCSYKFQVGVYTGGTYYIRDYSFTDKAKESRTKTIDGWKTKKDFHDPDKRQKDYQTIMKNCDASIGSIEEAFAFQQYWEQHSSEKSSLEGEKASLANQIEELKKSKAANPLYESKKSVESRISSLKTELGSLGLFKGKERKAVHEKIDAAKAELKNLTENIKASEDQYDAQIAPLQARISEIDAELKKSRGCVPLAHRNKPNIFVEGNNELQMSPVELLQYVKEKLPTPFGLKTGTEEDIINFSKAAYELGKALAGLATLLGDKSHELDEWKDDPNREKTYRINVFNGDKQTKTSIFCDAKSTKAAIEEAIWFQLDSGFTSSDATDFVKIVSMLIFDLLPSTDMSGLQSILAAGVYGIMDTKCVTSDGLKIEFKRSNTVTIKLSLE